LRRGWSVLRATLLQNQRRLMKFRQHTIFLFAALLLGGSAHRLPAQEPDSTQWNDPAVLALIERGIERRSVEVVDSALQTYSARGDGFVYFILDAPELDRQSLVRTDQVALEIYWRAPNQVRQRIVGMREQKELPITRLHYYLDRLTVVQDNYGQGIVIADGDNVNDVPHPVGRGATDVYDYRLADSLTLRIPSVTEPVRVHEIQVRPKDTNRPAVLGSIFLEANTGALVRMAFTFTPSAYIDPRLDYINVTLENGLWLGRYWLPHEQRLEIRRELPELDLPFGTVIRTRMRISGYEFNQPVPAPLFATRAVVTIVPPQQRENYEFDRPIDADWSLEGIGQPVEVGEIRREARAILTERAISGLPRNRPSIGAVSDILRYNRAEGVAVGAGWGTRPIPELQLRLYGGWAFGPRQPVLGLDVATGEQPALKLSTYVNRRSEVGGLLTTSGAANSLSALFLGRDWTDPFYASGAQGTVATNISDLWSLQGSVRLEHQRSAALTTTYSIFRGSDSFDPVRPIAPGDVVSASLAIRRDGQTVSGGSWAEARVTGGRLSAASESFDFGRAEISAGFGWSRSARRARIDVNGRAGLSLGGIPRQELYLLGGRASLPGYPYHAFAGDRLGLLKLQASADIKHNWARARFLGGVGWTGVSEDGRPAVDLWGTEPSRQLKPNLGVGVGLFYDLLHVDVARGLGSGGRTELIIEFQPDFWNFL
jgi:hypothetical protein